MRIFVRHKGKEKHLKPKAMTNSKTFTQTDFTERFLQAVNNELGGHLFTQCDMSGAISAELADGDTIYATPFWNDDHSVPVSVVSPDGDERFCFSFALDVANIEQAAKEYAKRMSFFTFDWN